MLKVKSISIIGAITTMGAMATLASCGSQADATLEQTKNVGVYVEQSGSLEELSLYGNPEQDGFQVIRFRFSSPIPERTTTAFIVNLPGASIPEAKLYLVPDPASATWHYSRVNDPRDPHPIAASIQTLSATIFRIAPTSLPRDAQGFLCLFVKMPLGIPDRLYAIRLPGTPDVPVAIPASSLPPEVAAALARSTNLEVRAYDSAAGYITIRNKATGETVTVAVADIQQGRISFQ